MSTSTYQSGNRPRRLRFTLVELLAAVALLAVLGGVLVRLYGNLQKAYNQSVRLAAMAEEARSVFALLGRDLRLSLTREDDIPGYSIKIHQPAESELWFVTANDSTSDKGASLLEVSYRLNGTTLERAEVDDSDPSWNPYGDRDDASQESGFQPVVDHVLSFSLTCYDSRLAALVPDQSTQAPTMVGVTISLIDDKSFAEWQRLESTTERDELAKKRARVFRKMIQIPAAQFTSL